MPPISASPFCPSPDAIITSPGPDPPQTSSPPAAQRRPARQPHPTPSLRGKDAVALPVPRSGKSARPPSPASPKNPANCPAARPTGCTNGSAATPYTESMAGNGAHQPDPDGPPQSDHASNAQPRRRPDFCTRPPQRRTPRGWSAMAVTGRTPRTRNQPGQASPPSVLSDRRSARARRNAAQPDNGRQRRRPAGRDRQTGTAPRPRRAPAPRHPPSPRAPRWISLFCRPHGTPSPATLRALSHPRHACSRYDKSATFDHRIVPSPRIPPRTACTRPALRM